MLLSVLGPLTADIDGDNVPVPAGMQRLLLAALLHRVRRPVPIDTLVSTLWPDEAPSKPEKALQLYVHRLRKLLGDPERIIHGPAGYTLVASRTELDWQCFEDLLRTARETRHSGNLDDAARRYAEALGLWRSEPFEDVDGGTLLLPEVQRLTALRVEARVEQTEVMVDRDRHGEALPAVTRLIEEFPRRESLYALLMLAHYRAGQVGEALAVYRRAQRLLADELGVEPGTELKRVHRAILNRSPRLDNAAPAPAMPVPAQLPAPIAQLTGRDDELRVLTRLDSSAPGSRVRAIDGMAGVGKSTLAIHAAHRLADRFPDGQLFADLRGSTPGMRPCDPVEVLGRLLEGLGVAGDRLPRDAEARAGLWRGMLRGKRMLILLDNAADGDQLRPLLPSGPGCLVLVTSRHRLTNLDNVGSVSLDVLPAPEAARLFTNVVGKDRLTDSRGLDEVLAACGGLPLALRLTAARFRDRPSWSLDQLAKRLRRDRPEVLSSDRHGIAGAFGIAYERLPDKQRLLFRRLSLHPGVDIGADAAAALSDHDLTTTENLLEALVDSHLLQSPDFGRYRFHDLMRRYAETLVAEEDPAHERDAAIDRLVEHYRRAALQAVGVAGLSPVTDAMHSGTGETSQTPGGEEFTDPRAALSWLDTERANLVAVIQRAAHHGRHGHVTAIAWTLSKYLSVGAHTAEELAVHRLAARMAEDSGDVTAQATARYQLGGTHLGLGQRDEALTHFTEALEAFRSNQNPRAQAAVHYAMANALDMGHRLLESLEHRRLALTLAVEASDLVGQCRALLGIAVSQRRLGHHADAREHCRRALRIAEDTGTAVYRAAAHEQLGHTGLACAELPAAIEGFTRSLEHYRELGNRRGQYQSRNGLGRALCARGSVDEALDQQRRAMDIVRDIDDPNAKLEGHLWLGQALAAAGQPRDARGHLDTALSLARRLEQPQDERRCQDLLSALTTR